MKKTKGFVSDKPNNFSISATELKNISPDIQVVLKDKQNNTEFELADGNAYVFSSIVTNDANRFSLIFKSKYTTTSLSNTQKEIAQVFVNTSNQIAIIAAEKSNYAIYNAVGQLIENGIMNHKLHTINCKLNTGVYVVKVANNQITKVIIK